MWTTSKSSLFQNTKNRGFTIVELLIVIVVIGLLVVIMIVAYRGIQQRATTARYTAAIDQWEKIVRMERSLQGGDDFTTFGTSCVGRSISDFPQTNVFAEGECVKDSDGDSLVYDEEMFQDWKVDRPITVLPVTTLTFGDDYDEGYWMKSRGIQVVTIPSANNSHSAAGIRWYPQVAGLCGRGVSDWQALEGDALAGGACTISIGGPDDTSP